MNRALWKYYVDVTRYNVAFSIVLGIITSEIFKGIFCFVTTGMIMGLVIYKQMHNNQYYFYYNIGRYYPAILFRW